MTRKYMDEQITTIIQGLEDEEESLQEANLAMEIAAQDLESGQVVIDGQTVDFAPRQFLNGRMSITIPTDWTELPPDLAKVKYPYEGRPAVILTDETTAFNLTIHHLPQPLEPKDVKECSESLRLYTARMAKAKFLGHGVVEETENNPIMGWYAFTVPGFDEELYNFVFCTALDHRGLLVSFNCLATEKERWHSIATGMMNTLVLAPQEQIIIQEGESYVLRRTY